MASEQEAGVNLSLRAIRLSGLALLAAYTVAFMACRAIPDSVGLLVIALAVLAAFGRGERP